MPASPFPTPNLLAKVVDLIDKVPMEDRDTEGDVYEYMLSQIATAGQNCQFRTPRHIISLAVECYLSLGLHLAAYIAHKAYENARETTASTSSVPIPAYCCGI